jgi:hypothetical protein
VEVDVTHPEAHLHGAAAAEYAGDHVERYLRFRSVAVFGGGIIVIIRFRQVQQEQALAHSVVTVLELFVAIEAQAELAAFFHLGRRQVPDGAALHRDGGGCCSRGRW